MPQERIFISYARKDGRELALKLQNSLDSDYEVWLDTSEIEGGASWGSDIEQAIDNCHILLALLSKGSYESEICRAEQLRALRQHKRVVPLLVQADADRPIHMESLNYRDFSLISEYEKHLSQLQHDLKSTDYNAPEIPPTYTNAPPLPNTFVERHLAMASLRKMILSDATDRRIALTALRGMGGIGKTILAQAICHDKAIQDAFPDGVFWIKIGREVTNLVDKMKIIGTSLGDPAEHYSSPEAATARLRKILPSKSVLIVLDDVWKLSDVQPFLVQAPQTRWLMTTRDGRISSNLGASELQLGKLTQEQSAELLREWAKQTDPHEVELVDVLDGHPLAVKLVGSKLAGGMAGEAWLASYDSVARIKDKRRPKLKDDSIELCFDISLESIESEDRPLYHALGIFPEDIWIPESSVAQLWQALDSELDAADCTEILIELEKLSLIEREKNLTALRMHDLLHSYNRHRLGEDYQATQRDLITAWGELTALPDLYTWQNIAYHLNAAGMKDELKALLLNIDFLQAKLEQTNPNALIDDCDYFDDEGMQLLQSGITFISHKLVKDTSVLPVEIRKCLAGYRSRHNEIKTLLQSQRTHQLLPIYQTFPAAGGNLIRVLEGHTDAIWRVTVSGDFVISASEDDSLIVWNYKTGESIHKLEGPPDPTSMTIQDEFALYAVDESLIVWNCKADKQARILEEHTDSILTMTASGDFVIFASGDKSLIIWNYKTGKFVHKLEGHSDYTGIVIQDEFVIFASGDKSLIIWNWQTDKHVCTLHGHAEVIYSEDVFAIAIQDEFAIFAFNDESLTVWNWKTDKYVHTLQGHSSVIRSVAIQGNYAISASEDTTLMVWNWIECKHIRTLEGHSSAVNSVVIQDDFVISASNDATLIIWNWMIDEQVPRLEGHADYVNSVAIQDDNAISASEDKTLINWNWRQGEKIRPLKQSSSIKSMAIQDNLVIFAFDDNTLVVRDWQKDETIREEWKENASVAISGHYAVFVCHEKKKEEDSENKVKYVEEEFFIIWDWRTDVQVRIEWDNTYRNVNGVAVSDKYIIFAFQYESDIIIWDWGKGEGVGNLKGHSDYVMSVAISEEIAISASYDQTLRVWNWQTGDSLRTLKGHLDSVNSVAIEGDFAISVSDDKTLIVWNWKTGERLATFNCDSPQNTVAIAEGVIVSGGRDGQVHFFRPNAALKQLLGW